MLGRWGAAMLLVTLSLPAAHPLIPRAESSALEGRGGAACAFSFLLPRIPSTGLLRPSRCTQQGHVPCGLLGTPAPVSRAVGPRGGIRPGWLGLSAKRAGKGRDESQGDGPGEADSLGDDAADMGEVVVVGGQRFLRKDGKFTNLDLPRGLVEYNVQLELAHLRGQEPPTDPIADDRFDLDEFDDDASSSGAEASAVGFGDQGDFGADPVGFNDPAMEATPVGAFPGQWAAIDVVTGGTEAGDVGAQAGEDQAANAMQVPVNTDDSVIKDYASAIEADEAQQGIPAEQAPPLAASGPSGGILDFGSLRELQRKYDAAAAESGENSTEAVAARHDLGVALTRLGQLEEAELHMHAVLQARVSSLGKKHPLSAGTCHDLAVLYEKKTDFDMALYFYEQAITGKQNERNNMVSVAATRANMGSCFMQLGEHQKALTTLINAYQVLRANLGEDHPVVAGTARNLGCAYMERQDHKKAIFYLNRALEVELRVGGEMSLDAAATNTNIGLALMDMGKLEEALVRFEQVLDVRLNTLGERHPHVALTVKNLGHVRLEMGEPERALKYYEKALRMEMEVHGAASMHMELATSRFNIAKILLGKRDPRAKRLFEQAAATFALRLGSHHPYTKSAMDGVQEATLASLRSPDAFDTLLPGDYSM